MDCRHEPKGHIEVQFDGSDINVARSRVFAAFPKLFGQPADIKIDEKNLDQVLCATLPSGLSYDEAVQKLREEHTPEYVAEEPSTDVTMPGDLL